MEFFCIFGFHGWLWENLAWLPVWQLWATLVICINSKWPPISSLEIRFSTIYCKMMSDTSFLGFLGMHNPFPGLKFYFKVKVTSNSRWPPFFSQENASCDQYIVEWCIMCLFVGFWGCTIHFWYWNSNWASNSGQYWQKRRFVNMLKIQVYHSSNKLHLHHELLPFSKSWLHMKSKLLDVIDPTVF